jgi:CubicO group peptidase (beta-lactamase class C family)
MTPRRLLTLLLTLALLMPCAAFAQDAPSRSLTRQMELNRQRYGIAGQALLVAHNGEVLFRGADGEADVDTHERVTAEHVFPSYSVSKLFVSTLIMQLAEQGALDMDTPASAYLPGLPVSWQAIPVRDFLDHTSGVPEYFDNRLNEGVTPVFPDDLPAAFAALAHKPLAFATGTDTRYTQTNYLVLAALLAAHYGKPYPQVAEERIVRRLGLRRTWLGPAAQPERDVVKSYTGKAGRLEADRDIAWPAYAYGHAGLHTTVDDLARFLQAMASGELVGKATLRRFWTPRVLAGGKPAWFASGWDYGRSGPYEQVGHDGGMRVRVRILFEDSLEGDVYLVAYLTNGSTRNVWSRLLVDSAMAVAAPDKFPREALSQTLADYAMQTPAEGDVLARARWIRGNSGLDDGALERTVNAAGYAIRENLGIDAALRVFELNTVLFPQSANTWDSLAEAHAAKGDTRKAKALYDKAHRLLAPVGK